MTVTRTLQSEVTKAASFSGADVVLERVPLQDLLITLLITSAERDSGNETYDIYITSGNGLTKWDICHFPQVATTGAKTYVATVKRDLLPQTVTTAAPGVTAVVTGTMKTDTAGSDQGIKTLGAGMIRDGFIGDRIGHELVVAGTVATGITYQISFMGRD